MIRSTYTPYTICLRGTIDSKPRTLDPKPYYGGFFTRSGILRTYTKTSPKQKHQMQPFVDWFKFCKGLGCKDVGLRIYKGSGFRLKEATLP